MYCRKIFIKKKVTELFFQIIPIIVINEFVYNNFEKSGENIKNWSDRSVFKDFEIFKFFQKITKMYLF